MRDERFNRKFQKFYINSEGVICGIVSPREIWRFTVEFAKEYRNALIKRIAWAKSMGNFDLAKRTLAQAEKEIKQLEKLLKIKEGVVKSC